MNGYMNIRVRMLTGNANAQVKALRENLEKFDRAFKSVKKTSAGMSGIKVFGADQLKRMREARDVSSQLSRNFGVLDKNLKGVAKTQAVVSGRAFIRKDQIESVKVMNSALRELTATIGVYKTTSAGMAKTQFTSAPQTASLRRLTRSLETIAKAQATVQVEAQKMQTQPMVSPAASAQVEALKKEVIGLRQAMAATQAQAAKGVTVAAGPVSRGASADPRGTEAADRATQRYTGSLGANRNAIARWGSQLQWAGRQLQYNFTLPILLAGGFAMKFALDQEKAMVHVRKVYGDEADAMAYWQKERGMTQEQARRKTEQVFNSELESLDRYFGELSTYFATNKTEVLEVAGAWAAAGVSGKELAESVKNTLTAAAIGDMSTAQATKALISIQAQYGLNAKGLAEALAYLNSVENATGAGMQDLITGFQKAAGVARNGGIEIRYLAADIAALVPAAGNAAEAGNALKSIIGSLARPTKAGSAAIAKLGFDTNSTEWASMNMQERLLGMAKSFKGLDKSLQNTIAVTIAGRWQFNRFSALMRELESENGYYQKALNSTSSRTKALAIAQGELDTILQSNPARLKRVGVALQNSLADIIQPLIPAIISLAQTVADVTKAFQNLPGPVQKAAMYLAIFLVVMPLMVRYIGAVTVLFGYMRIATVTAGGAVLAFTTGAGRLLAFPFVAVAALWTSMMTAIGWAVGMGMALVRTNFVKFLPWILMRWQGFFKTMIASAVISMRILAFAMMGGAKAALMRVGAAILAAFTSPWILAAAAAVGILYLFWDEITAIWNNIMRSLDGGYLAEMFGNVVRNIIAAFNVLPQGVQNALIAVVNMVREAALAVYDWFSYINPWARHSPSLVENVRSGMKAVVNEFSSLKSIQSYIKGAYATMRQFGNATANLVAANKKMGEMSDRGLIAKGAPGALRIYDQLIDKLHVLQGMYSALGERIQKAEAKIAPGLAQAEEAIWRNQFAQKQLELQLAKVEKKYGDIEAMRERLKALDSEQAGLAEMSTGLRQAGAGSDILSFYDDQIAALEAQRQPLQQATNQVDELKRKLEELQRQGNLLNLEKEVEFGPALHQIDLMKDKYQQIGSAIQDIKGAIDDATQAQNSLNQAREQKKNARKAAKSGGAAGAGALPGGVGNFAQAGGKGLDPRTDWSSQASAIDDMTDQLIQDAGDAFGKINPFKSFVGWFKKTLDTIKSRFLPDGQKLFNDVFGGGDSAKAQATLDSLQEKFKTVGNGIGSAIGGIVKVGKMLWDFFGPEIMDIFQGVMQGFQDMWNFIKPELLAWGRDILPIGEALWNLAKIVLAIGAVILKVLLGIIGGAIQPLLTALGLLLSGVSKIIRGVLKTLAGIINFFYHLFTGQWSKLGDDLKDIWNGIWTAILGIFQSFISVIVAVVGGLIGAIVGIVKSLGRMIWSVMKWVGGLFIKAWNWIYDVLVGHSIVPDMVDRIIWFIKLLIVIPVWIFNNVLMPMYRAFINVWNNYIKPFLALWWAGMKIALAGLVALGKWIWDNVLAPAYRGVKRVWTLIKGAFLLWWAGVKAALSGLKSLGKWVWDNALSPAYSRVKSVWSNYIKPAFGNWWGGIKNALSGLKSMAKWIWDNALNPVYSKFKSLITTVGKWIGDNIGKIVTPMKRMVNGVISAVNKMIDGLNLLDKLPGISFKIGHISPLKLAEGGAIPNRRVGSGWVTNGARAIVGEGKANHPEYVIPTDPTHRNRAMSLYRSLGQRLGMADAGGNPAMDQNVQKYDASGVPVYALGGIIGDVGKALGSVKNAAKESMEFVKKHARNAASAMYKPVGAIVDNKISKIDWSWTRDGAKSMHGQVRQWIKGADDFVHAAYKQSGGKWVKPLNGGYSIGGGLGSYKGHNGQDFPVPAGTKVRAITKGVVTSSRDIGPKPGGRNSGGYGSYGRVVEVRHSNGYKSLYAHNRARNVSTGDSVMPGDVLAHSGSTGNSSGNHLHLSIWKSGALKAPLDVLRSHGVKMAEGGIAKATRGGVLATIAEGGQDELVTPLPRGFNPADLGKGGDTYNHYDFGDATFEFPNITDPNDAEEFLRNLENAVKD